MAGLSSNPAFQRAMLKRRAQAIGGGQNFNTADLTRQFTGHMMGRELQFQGIEDQKRRSLKGIAQQGQLMGLDRQRLGMAQNQLKSDRQALPLTLGIGLGTSVLAGLEGRRRTQAMAASNQEQQAWQRNLMNMLAYQKQGKLRGGR